MYHDDAIMRAYAQARARDEQRESLAAIYEREQRIAAAEEQERKRMLARMLARKADEKRR